MVPLCTTLPWGCYWLSRHQVPALTESHECQWGRKLVLRSNFTASSSSRDWKQKKSWRCGELHAPPMLIFNTSQWQGASPQTNMRCMEGQRQEALQWNEGETKQRQRKKPVWKSLPSSNLPSAWKLCPTHTKTDTHIWSARLQPASLLTVDSIRVCVCLYVCACRSVWFLL